MARHGPVPVPAATRFERFYIPEPNSGCWLWLGAVDRHGYGIFTSERSNLAHRFSWELHRSLIPQGLVIDHLCRNRACVNPDHMRVVTQRANVLDNSDGITATLARQPCCAKCGEPFRKLKKQRRCVNCRREWERERYQNQKVAADTEARWLSYIGTPET